VPGSAGRRLDDFADAVAWCPGYDELAEHLHVDERAARTRIVGLTAEEKDHIERRLAAREGAA
jgi:hypothetical protein